MVNPIRFLFTASLCVIFSGCNRNDNSIYPQKSAITESVYASLTIQPDSMYQAYSVASGIIESILVEEGEKVIRGTALVKIKNESPQLSMANARLAYVQARDDLYGENDALTDLKAQIRTARLQTHDDSINYVRQQRLWDRKIGSRTNLEQRKLAYELSKNRLENLESSYDRLVQELSFRMEQTENDYKSAQVATEDYTLRSQINGMVYSLEKEPGEKVTIQEPVAVLGSDSSFVMEMLIDERDITSLVVGQKVLVTLEAFGDKVFESRVTKIFPRKNERNQTFKVEARFSGESPEVLYAGLSGEANIVINQKAEALTIPSAYLADANHVKTENGLVEVQVGLKSLDRIEILSGIDSTTLIYRPE